MRLYLDTGCLNRPLDDPAQPRVFHEGEAVKRIVRNVEYGRWEWLVSDILLAEVDHPRHTGRRLAIERWLAFSTHYIETAPSIVRRGERFESWGIHHSDGLHLAAAEMGGADVFLTTDDRLIRAAVRHADELRVQVANPQTWLERLEPWEK